jgi:peptidoglycan/LPS O-acetylase OafA/YrhL
MLVQRPVARLVSVDALRALAALWVLIHHTTFFTDDLPFTPSFVVRFPFRFGFLGVPMFVVLSGFCIHLGVARKMAAGAPTGTDWGRFWKRRFFRLYPPYVAAIFVSLVIVALIGPSPWDHFRRWQDMGWDLLSHLLMVHNLFAEFCHGLGNSPFWSLGMEEQLYMLFAVYLLVRRAGVAKALAVALAVSAAWPWVARWWLGGDTEAGVELTVGGLSLHPGPITRSPFFHWFAWVLGAVAAEAYAGVITLPRWCSRGWAAVLLGVATLAMNNAMTIVIMPRGRLASLLGVEDLTPYLIVFDFLSSLIFPLAVFVWLNCWLDAEKRGGFRGRLAGGLAAVGVMSYSLYLLHFPLIRLTDAFLPQDRTLAVSLLRVAVQVPFCLVCAAIFFWLVERWFLVRRSPKSPAPAHGLPEARAAQGDASQREVSAV